MTISEPKTQQTECPISSVADEFDPFNDPYLSDPYAFLAKSRQEQPVFYSPEIDYYVVTKFDEIRKVFRNTPVFSAEVALEPLMPLWESSIEKVIEAGYIPGPALVNEDEPIHMQRRKRIGMKFEAGQIAELEPQIRRIVTSYLDRMVKRGNADLIDDFVWEIPALVIFMFMGVPEDEASLVKQYAARRTLFTWGRPTEEEQNQLVEEVGTYWQYCVKHVNRLRENLGDDFMSDVIRAQIEDPELFDDTYLYNTMLNFLFAGHETTTNASGNAFRVLLENLDSWKQICSDPALIPNTVEEILRYQSSVIAWRRRAKEATEIGGVEIPAGANVLLVLGSGNHDEEMFPDGETLDIHRDNAYKHLSFGFGTHMCMGAHLARLEMRIILEELTKRLPHARLVPNQSFEYSPNTSFRGPDHVLIEWDPSQNPVPQDRA